MMLCVTRAYHGDILEELDIIEGLEEGLDVDSLIGQVVHSVVSLQGLLQRGDKGAQLIKILGQICFFKCELSSWQNDDCLPKCNRE